LVLMRLIWLLMLATAEQFLVRLVLGGRATAHRFNGKA
jgi:hypothetical protein